MTFSSSILSRMFWGSQRVHWGSFTNGGADTGGDIDTGLYLCEGIVLVFKSGAAMAAAPVVNEDFSSGPLDGSAITIVTEAGADGYWLAFSPP